MNFAELLKSLIENSRERIKTPITGAYLLAFLIWNWRPILLLIFENTTITNKIIVINHEYCGIWAILGPFGVALIFTIGVPYLMVVIEKFLRKPKSDRQMYSYEEKVSDLDMKIKLATKELLLQDIVSRNKEKEDFVVRIDQLEDQLENEKKSHKRQIDEYQIQIKDLNKLVARNSNNKSVVTLDSLSDDEKEIYYTVTGSSLTGVDVSFLKGLPSDTQTPINIIEYPVPVIKFLEENKFSTASQNNEIFLTSKGLRLKSYLNN